MENLEEFQKMKVKREFGNASIWIKRIFVGIVILLLISLFVSNLCLVNKLKKTQTQFTEEIIKVKQEIATTYESEIKAVEREAFLRDSNLVELIKTLNINVKDLTNVVQVTTKSTQKFEKQIGRINGEINNTKSLLIQIDSTLKQRGDTLDIGFIQFLLENVPCNPKGIYKFSDYSTNFKWDATLNFDKDTFQLIPRYESTLTLLTSKNKAGFLGLSPPTYKVTIASDDPYAKYTINGATILPPKEIISLGVGFGYGITYVDKNFKFSPTLNVGVYKKLLTIYKS